MMYMHGIEWLIWYKMLTYFDFLTFAKPIGGRIPKIFSMIRVAAFVLYLVRLIKL